MNRKQFITTLGLGAAAMPGLLEAEIKLKTRANTFPTKDWEQIRKQFPVLKKRTYMNNGTMGITPIPVLKALEEAFEYVANEGYYSSDVESLRKRLAPIVGADYTTLAITKNVTEGINIACWGQELKAGDEVLMTKHEHVGGCTAWLYRAKTEGIKIRTFELGKTAEATLINFKKAISPKTKVIAVPHIPCTIGQILPVKEMCAEARRLNITSIIDGAHPLGMLKFNISEIDCDYYAGCLHKWLLAPLGLGFVYIRKEKLEQTKVYNVGAYSVPGFDMTAENLTSEELVPSTQRFSTGTFCAPIYAAAETAIDWYQAIGIERIEKRVKELSLFTQEELEKFRNHIEILSPKEDVSRGAQTTFQFKNKNGPDFLKFAMSSKDVFVLRHVHEAKLDAIRVSTHYYNDFSQIERLMGCIAEYIKK